MSDERGISWGGRAGGRKNGPEKFSFRGKGRITKLDGFVGPVVPGRAEKGLPLGW